GQRRLAGADFLFAAGATPVEPDRVPAGVGAEEVAGREVLQPDAAGLVDDDAVVALVGAAFRCPEGLVGFGGAAPGRSRLGAVDHDPVAVHPADVDPGSGDEDVRGSAVVAL